MKKMRTYPFLLGLALCGLPFPLQAQKVSTVERGDTVLLKSAEGYSSYQWQVSTDLKYFADLPQGKVRDLALKVNAPGYYRMKVTDAERRVTYLDTVGIALAPVTYHKDFSISGGGHGYVETVNGDPHASGINIPEDRVNGVAGTSKKLTSWQNGEAMAVYYFNHPAEVVDTKMRLKVKAGKPVTFRVKVFDPEQMDVALAENILAIKGMGTEQEIPLVAAHFPRKTYYRYQLECLEGWKDIVEISQFHHYSPSVLPTYKAAYRSSPSVHLGKWRSTHPQAPKGDAYDWCYQEVKMPKESDILGTYAMSLGILKGYMGIQVNGYDDQGPIHGVLFSIWDDGSTDKDPNLPVYRRAVALDHGEDVVVKRFGNEGTGVQTFKRGHCWECDRYVQFITSSQPETAYYYVEEQGRLVKKSQKNTLVSAWYNAQDGRGWQYMATIRVPNKDQNFNSWYSFLENYNAATGQVERKSYYRNGYARSKYNKVWYHCNSVKFGHTDGGSKVGARNDFSQGVSEEEPGAFFMATGGYRDSYSTKNVMPLNKDNTAVDTIRLGVLTQRVEQAIAYEKSVAEEEEEFLKNRLSKDLWEVVDFSSQEVVGERENGRAAQIIDGNEDSYWHPQWKGNRAEYPHYLTVDMHARNEMRGMEITQSGGTNRYVKAFHLYVSEDNQHWEKVYSETDAPDLAKFRFMLPAPVTARYFKLEITDGRSKDGDFVRINEVSVCGHPVQTGISGVSPDSQEMEVVSRQQELQVTLSESIEGGRIALYAADGTCWFSDDALVLLQGESLHIPMNRVPDGVYVLSCTAGNRKLVRNILWKR